MLPIWPLGTKPWIGHITCLSRIELQVFQYMKNMSKFFYLTFSKKEIGVHLKENLMALETEAPPGP